MAENQKSIDGIIEKLALITDATQNLFPSGKTAIIFELDYEDYKKVQQNFRQIDQGYKQFKIDLSGVEVIFILKGTFDVNEPQTPKEEKKIGFFRKLVLSFISRKFTVKN
jgi:hypothetical protein